MSDFSFKLKSLRELRGWTQEDLARRLKVTRSTVGNYELGYRTPTFEHLEAIADIFNCPISYLVEEIEIAEIKHDGGFPSFIIKDKNFDKMILESVPGQDNELIIECVDKVRKLPEHTLEVLKSYLDFLLSQSQADEPDKKT